MSDLPSSPVLLEARGLSFLRRDEPIFGPLDFVVHAGEVVLVEGDNGSGKTTLLKTLTGMLRCDEGRIDLYGKPLTRERAAGEVCLLGHQLALKVDLSGLENLRYSEGLYGRRRGVTANSALQGVGLAGYEHEPVRQLSAGQKKRTALARLLLIPAAVWLLDEPWANLDRDGIALVNRMLERHTHEGGAAMVTSHGAVTFLPGTPRRIRLTP